MQRALPGRGLRSQIMSCRCTIDQEAAHGNMRHMGWEYLGRGMSRGFRRHTSMPDRAVTDRLTVRLLFSSNHPRPMHFLHTLSIAATNSNFSPVPSRPSPQSSKLSSMVGAARSRLAPRRAADAVARAEQRGFDAGHGAGREACRRQALLSRLLRMGLHQELEDGCQENPVSMAKRGEKHVAGGEC